MGNASSSIDGEFLMGKDKQDGGLEARERLKECYYRVLPISHRNQGMDKDIFRYLVLAHFPRIPKSLAERIFDVLNLEHSGFLQLTELLTGLELSREFDTTTSTIDTKLFSAYKESQCKLLFAIYDMNDSGLLQREVLERFVVVVYGAVKLPLVEAALDVIFDPTTLSQPPFLTYSEFHTLFLGQAEENQFLFLWLTQLGKHVGRGPDPAVLALQQAYSVVHIRERIEADTLLTLEEICLLEKWFQKALNSSPSGQRIETNKFVQKVFGMHTTPEFCLALEQYIGPLLDFHQFCLLISHFTRDPREKRLRFLFRIFVDNFKQRLRPDVAATIAIAAPPLPLDRDCARFVSPVIDIGNGETYESVLKTLPENDLTISEFVNATFQLGSMQRLLHRLAFAVCSQFNCSITPKDPAIEHYIIHMRWQEYSNTTEGQMWYLIDTDWWYAWCSYCHFHLLNGTSTGTLPFPPLSSSVVQYNGVFSDKLNQLSGERPPRINNWSLQDRAGSRRLKPNMVVGQHFHVLLPEPVYNTLVSWYNGGPAFARSIIVLPDNELELEMYPLVLRVGKTDARGDVTVSGEEVLVGTQTLSQTILQECCQALVLRDVVDKARLWSFKFGNPASKVLIPRDILPHEQLRKDSVLLVEVQDNDGSWPLSQPEESLEEINEQGGPEVPKSSSNGLVGLDNLGNTCYMSSAIQCLSHSRLLSDYFRTGLYRYDINIHNKLGTQGNLAVAFGNLLCQIWSTTKKHLSPASFKTTLAKFNKHFDNSEQHDAQELLAFLLSGLSEDLNRVTEPPTNLTQADSNGRLDIIVADEWWQNFLQREVSIIVALFMGQYKSLLHCNTCHYQSACFEPFTFLQLPLPESTMLHFVLTVVFHTGQPPLRCTIAVDRDGTVRDAKAAICAILQTSQKLLLIASIKPRAHVIHSIYSDSYKVASFRDDELLVAYQLENKSVVPQPDLSTYLKVGDAVGVQNDRGSTPSHARITRCNDNGTYDIAFWTGKPDFGYSRTRLIQYAGQIVHIYLVHRRMEHSSVYFSDPSTLRLFGTPLILPFVPSVMTGYDLYMAIWQRLHRIFHWHTPPQSPGIFIKRLQSQVATVALGRHLNATKFGFCLRFVTMDGLACSRCSWLEGCRGCLVSSDATEPVQLCGRETLAMDWDLATMTEEYDGAEASKVEIHPSFEKNKAKVEAPLSIASCLEEFTAKEPMDEAYCGRCKTLSPSTKKMDLWRLPPLLIIQLKRFQYTATSRKKLRQLVHFPLRGLDLQSFLVSPQVTPGLEYWQFLGGKLAPTQRSEDNIYDLYAVINHIGALGAGHYVANILSEVDNKWKCFNDHLCRDIDERDVVSSSAYILFYTRRDMKSLPVQQVFPPNMTSPLSDQDIASMLQERDNSPCTIS
ncbi:ubiquitin-specific protease [Thraustotheca clavata]|uniref:ubiquitinyl hydrolase 1 n=1 Tax=Thraustotheca clavata TaxID=74557 RepID=A0A1W0A4D2_9STRA|nr:ubiquitin-specific protease [Thraustotheca clavata]